MNLLLDTHTFLWAIWGNDKLSAAAEEAFLNPNNVLFLSMASHWEICIKHSIGKLRLAPDWQSVFVAEMAANGIKWLNISKEHCYGIGSLPQIHRDPFDRLLVAQAQVEELTIVSNDDKVQQYGVKTIW